MKRKNAKQKPFVVTENGIRVQKAVISLHNDSPNPFSLRPKYFDITYDFTMAFDVIEFQIPGYAPTQLWRSDLARFEHVKPTKHPLKNTTYFRVYPDAVIPVNAQDCKSLRNTILLHQYLQDTASFDFDLELMMIARLVGKYNADQRLRVLDILCK